MSRENLETLLHRIGQRVGIPALGLDADGHCMVRIDEIELTIEFAEESDSVILSARCGALPVLGKDRLLQDIADANFFWLGSGGGTLSTNSREGALYLQYRELSAQLDEQRLDELLQGVVLNAEYWGSRLAGAEPEAPAAVPFFDRA